MSWRVAKSLDRLLVQLNEAAPKRSKISDGSIGDADHANRSSDHNPWCGPGVVTARDFTHDPDNGANMHKIAEEIRQSKDDRVKYVIWDKRMFSSYPTSTHAAWEWRPYSGVNLHTAHMHVSVNCGRRMDNERDWKIGGDWSDMATKEEIKSAVEEVVSAAEARIKKEVAAQRKILAVGKTQKGYDPDKVNVKAAMKAE